jgi:serine/threonine protein kinase/tetratricopeptide (TPR) repeat protein
MALPAGTRLGPYEILSPLGAGGMGEVYRARDTRLGREVAIKVLPASFSEDPDRLRRFEQEARAASSLNHPNILTVHDIGARDGAPYVVFELLDGDTLRGRLAGGALPPRKANDCALQIARGLAAAHEKGIVHRDLKPENIFVTRDGTVKILDFGLAKFAEPASGAVPESDLPTAGTQPGVVLGTLGYMSPEQVRGKPADARSDIFAFGAILYEMLSGERAFRGESAADTMSAILTKEPPEPSKSNPDVSPGLDRVVRHCLEKDPEQRSHSAHDLAFDLTELSGVSAPVPARSAGGATRRFGLIVAGGAVLAAAVVVIILLRTRNQTSGPAASDSERRSIAVLPFQNLSPDPENAFFADGMTEDILTQLSKIRDLKVISRSSVMRYKGSFKPIKTIASELGVGNVLEGSVRREGNRVRIAGQLIDARTDEHLWAETYDRDLKDVFAIQSEVAQQIAGALRATLSPAEKKRIGQSPTQNLEAYDEYLKGRELYNHYRKSDNEAAIERFRKAMALDPALALAYAGLGDAYAQGVQRYGLPQSSLALSFQMSRKAIDLDPELAEGHKALGLAYFVQAAYRESLREERKAVEVNPNLAPAVANVGFSLWLLGEADEALRWLLRGAELDPRNPIAAAGVGGVYTVLDDASSAERWLKRSLELQPDLNQAHTFLIFLYLHQKRDEEAVRLARAAVALLPEDNRVWVAAARAELVTGNLPRARQLFELTLPAFRGARVGPRIGGAGVETHVAFFLTHAGNGAEAKKLLDEALATDRRLAEEGSEDWSVSYDAACVHALRGEKGEAFRWLDKAIETGWRGWPLGTRDPLLDSLRSDSRFQKLETRLETLVSQMRRRAGLS